MRSIWERLRRRRLATVAPTTPPQTYLSLSSFAITWIICALDPLGLGQFLGTIEKIKVPKLPWQLARLFGKICSPVGAQNISAAPPAGNKSNNHKFERKSLITFLVTLCFVLLVSVSVRYATHSIDLRLGPSSSFVVVFVVVGLLKMFFDKYSAPTLELLAEAEEMFVTQSGTPVDFT